MNPHNAKHTQNNQTNNGTTLLTILRAMAGDLSSRYRERMERLGYIKPAARPVVSRALTAEELAAKRLFDVNKTLRDWPKKK
jgi:hypothetical protein